MKILKPDIYDDKRIRVTLINGKIFQGDYIGHTTELDDPNERANIDLDADNGFGYTLYEDEIESIAII